MSKKQDHCIAILEAHGNANWLRAFRRICDVNGRKWRSALVDQFMHDENVCGIENELLPFVRQIRNSLVLDAALR